MRSRRRRMYNQDTHASQIELNWTGAMAHVIVVALVPLTKVSCFISLMRLNERK